VGRGARTHGLLGYLHEAVRDGARGEPCRIHAAPGTRVPFMHVRDAARAFVDLARAPAEDVRTVNYIVLGENPCPTATGLAEAMAARRPRTRLEFDVNPDVQRVADAVSGLEIDDSFARREWGWRPRYDAAAVIDDLLGSAGAEVVASPPRRAHSG